MNTQLLTQPHFERFGESGFLEKAASLMDVNVVLFDNPTAQEWHGVNEYSRLQMKGKFTGTLRTAEGIIFGNGNTLDIEYQLQQEFTSAGEVRRLVFHYDLKDFIYQLSHRYRAA